MHNLKCRKEFMDEVMKELENSAVALASAAVFIEIGVVFYKLLEKYRGEDVR